MILPENRGIALYRKTGRDCSLPENCIERIYGVSTGNGAAFTYADAPAALND